MDTFTKSWPNLGLWYQCLSYILHATCAYSVDHKRILQIAAIKTTESRTVMACLGTYILQAKIEPIILSAANGTAHILLFAGGAPY